MIVLQQRLIAVTLIVLQCWLVSELTGQIWFSVVACVAAAAGIWFSVPLSPIVCILLALALAAFVTNQAVFDPPSIRIDWILPGRFTASICKFLIGLQVIELVRTRNGEALSSRFIGFALASFLVAFCRAETIRNSFWFYWLAVAIVSLLAMFAVSPRQIASAAGAGLHKSARTIKWLVVSGIIAGVALGTGYFANSVKATTGLLRYLVTEQVNNLVTVERASVAFSLDGNLSSVTTLKQISPDETALNGVCIIEPGYLRGRVFATFRNDRWSVGGSRDIQGRRIRPDESPQFSSVAFSDKRARSFQVGPNNPEPLRSVTVTKAKVLVGKAFFTPVRNDYVFCRSATIGLDEHDVLRDGLSANESYTSCVARDRKPTDLSSAQRRDLLQVPNSVRKRLQATADRICARLTTTEQKVNEVERYFRTGFEYSLNSFEDTGRNRLVDFVLNGRSGHCEYFATAAAMILRLNGVPCRYVSGFTMVQPSESDDNSGDMWVARNRDAHAWVEAYDDQNKQWLIVEATPGVDAPKYLWREGTMQQFAGSAMQSDQEEEATRSGFSFESWLQSIGTGFAWLRQRLNWLLNVILLCALPVLVKIFLGERAKQRLTGYAMKQYARRMRKLDKRLAKRNLIRRRSETLHQFAGRLLSVPEDDSDWVHEAAGEYLSYANKRYSQSLS